MQPDIAARHLLRTLGSGRCRVVGDAAAPLVQALLAYGVDVTCHAPSADVVAAGNAATPGRFTQGAADAPPPGRTGQASVIFINALDALDVARVRIVLAHCRSAAQAAILIVVDGEASRTPAAREPRDRAWWEARCMEAGFRRHPRGHQLWGSNKLGAGGGGVTVLCEPVPQDVLTAAAASPATMEVAARDPLRIPGAEAAAFMARYAWVARWIKLGDTVLDVSCGTGAGSWILTRLTKAARIIGVDPRADEVDYARMAFRSPRLEFAKGDLRRILDDLPADSVDCIVAYEVIGGPAETASLLQSIGRVLAPAGRLIVGARPPSGESRPTGAGKRRQTLRDALRPWFLVDVAAYQVVGGLVDAAGAAHRRPHITTFNPAAPRPGEPADWLLAVALKPFTDAPQPPFRHRVRVDGLRVQVNSNDFPAMLDNPWLHRGLLDGGMRPADPVPLRALCETILAQSGPKDQAAALTILGYRLAEDKRLPSRQLADHLARIDDWFERHLHRADEAQITRWLVSLSFLGGILALRMGDLAAAVSWFDRCLTIDAAIFGPLLFTKTVEAAHRLGWIYYGQANLPEARRAWTCGIEEASRALALRHDAGAHPRANRLPFVFDEYGAICDMATRCALALSHVTVEQDSLDLGPALFRPRERCVELEAELAVLRRELAEVKASAKNNPAKTDAPSNLFRLIVRYFLSNSARHKRSLRMRTFVLALVGLVLGAACPPPPKVALSFSDRYAIDTAGFATHDLKKPFYFNLRPPAGALPYLFTSDIGTQFGVWLASTVPPGTASPEDRSLGIKITANEAVNVKDKIVLDAVLHSSSNRIDLNDPDTTRYIGFDLMLDPRYEVPNGWALHMQVWQCCGGHPPFSVHVTPGHDKNGPVEFTVDVTDDDNEVHHYNKPKIIYRMPMQRSIWNRLTFMLEPHPDGSQAKGAVIMWLNGQKTFSYQGFWGYRPGGLAPVTHARLTSHLGIDLGTYRRRQTTTQIIYLDNIRYGLTYSAVVPTRLLDAACP